VVLGWPRGLHTFTAYLYDGNRQTGIDKMSCYLSFPVIPNLGSPGCLEATDPTVRREPLILTGLYHVLYFHICMGFLLQAKAKVRVSVKLTFPID